jgi:hypothetical protein
MSCLVEAAHGGVVTTGVRRPWPGMVLVVTFQWLVGQPRQHEAVDWRRGAQHLLVG